MSYTNSEAYCSTCGGYRDIRHIVLEPYFEYEKVKGAVVRTMRVRVYSCRVKYEETEGLHAPANTDNTSNKDSKDETSLLSRFLAPILRNKS